jgi:hypothetical protein
LDDSEKSQHPQRSTFRVNKRDHKILNKNKKNLAKRLKRKNYSDQPEPMFQPGNLHYEMAERGCAVALMTVGQRYLRCGRTSPGGRFGVCCLLTAETGLASFCRETVESGAVRRTGALAGCDYHSRPA